MALVTQKILNTNQTILKDLTSILATMISVVTNPLFYGFMNENFQKEFAKIFEKCWLIIGLKRCRTNASSSTNGNIEIPLQDGQKLSNDLLKKNKINSSRTKIEEADEEFV